jgi:hypothetical protein
LAGSGGHGIGDVSDAIFLLGGEVEVHPPSLLPLRPGENPKSPDWAATALGRHVLLGVAALGLRKVTVLRVFHGLQVAAFPEAKCGRFQLVLWLVGG